MRVLRTTLAIAGSLAALTVSASSAAAHGTENHAAAAPTAPAAAGTSGGGANIGTIPTVNEPVTGGGAADTPAPGAQPAAPSGLPPVVNGGVGNTTNTTNTTKVVTPVTSGAGSSGSSNSSSSSSSSSSSMLETISEPVTASASGGGGVDDVNDAGPTAVPHDAPTVSGAGDLPFTGIEETMLLISLAGMLVPIGVLLYSFARHGELRWLRRHLAAPRFEWAPAPGVRPEANRRPDVR